MNESFLIQTRDVEGNLQYFETLRKAVEFADKHPTVFKISISLPSKEQLRLVRSKDAYGVTQWTWEPIAKDIY